METVREQFRFLLYLPCNKTVLYALCPNVFDCLCPWSKATTTTTTTAHTSLSHSLVRLIAFDGARLRCSAYCLLYSISCRRTRFTIAVSIPFKSRPWNVKFVISNEWVCCCLFVKIFSCVIERLFVSALSRQCNHNQVHKQWSNHRVEQT